VAVAGTDKVIKSSPKLKLRTAFRAQFKSEPSSVEIKSNSGSGGTSYIFLGGNGGTPSVAIPLTATDDGYGLDSDGTARICENKACTEGEVVALKTLKELSKELFR